MDSSPPLLEGGDNHVAEPDPLYGDVVKSGPSINAPEIARFDVIPQVISRISAEGAMSENLCAAQVPSRTSTEAVIADRYTEQPSQVVTQDDTINTVAATKLSDTDSESRSEVDRYGNTYYAENDVVQNN